MNPFTQSADESLASLGESNLIELIKTSLGSANPASPQGIGDDCAVFAAPLPGEKQLITTDPVIYGYHFDDSLSPAQTAEKLLKRNLSDIAAMGGAPTLAVIGLALPSNVSISWIRAFYEALARAATRYKLSVVGGDVSSTARELSAHMTLIGSVPEREILLRGNAAPGCALYVTGSLGGSIFGKHFAFEPRLAAGRWLAQQAETCSCMDLSDGLGKDCRHLLAPDTTAQLDAQKIPISPDALTLSERTSKTPLHHAINDGEDFELLFALAPGADLEAFELRWREAFTEPLYRIGEVTARASASEAQIQFLNTNESLSIHGYEHLA